MHVADGSLLSLHILQKGLWVQSGVQNFETNKKLVGQILGDNHKAIGQFDALFVGCFE